MLLQSIGLTNEMALELSGKNIQVNAVAAGVVETAMKAGYFGNPEAVEGLKKIHVVGRWAQPQEIAQLNPVPGFCRGRFISGSTFSNDLRSWWSVPLQQRPHGDFTS